MIKKVCENCGSENVMIDAYAAWCEEQQKWELHSVYDHGFCDDCDGERVVSQECEK